ncbi:hypothetical protein BDQ17DRAFT_1433619 [Cyathus striatus]|nr:hypothetical protein BDQ17DRAFT_1433619 [Cyathus striatus]
MSSEMNDPMQGSSNDAIEASSLPLNHKPATARLDRVNDSDTALLKNVGKYTNRVGVDAESSSDNDAIQTPIPPLVREPTTGRVDRVNDTADKRPTSVSGTTTETTHSSTSPISASIFPEPIIDNRLTYGASMFSNIQCTTINVRNISNYARSIHQEILSGLLRDGLINIKEYCSMYEGLTKAERDNNQSYNTALFQNGNYTEIYAGDLHNCAGGPNRSVTVVYDLLRNGLIAVDEFVSMYRGLLIRDKDTIESIETLINPCNENSGNLTSG